MNADQVAALVCAASAVVMFAGLVLVCLLARRTVRRLKASNVALRAKNRQLTAAFDGLARVADRMPEQVAQRVRYAQVIAHLPARLFTTPSTKEGQ